MSFLDVFPLNHRLTNARLNGRYPRAWYRHAFQIDHPLGADLLVRTDTIRRVGTLDEGYFIYAEEVDWCFRIRQAGWEIWYTPDAEFIHHGGASTRQNAGPMLRQLHRSRDRFFQKHYGGLYAWLARRILASGVGRSRRLARRQMRRGEIDAAELARQLDLLADLATW